ncbi:MAG: bifunctional ornithine acetyltransferase/N-acetylglutamate synthase [Lentisphaeria bacterium]|nr:bifunctional ornithine acetyltransferase/N-acetylglutamate synthase [Lentisphaeria bacterium]
MEFRSRESHREWLQGQAVLPAGFRVGTTRFGFEPMEVPRRATMTLTLLAVDAPTPDFAAVFTRNAFPGAPVLIGRGRLMSPRLGAILVNNKISNVCAPDGVNSSERLCAEVARSLALQREQVLPCSTGVIGWRLPVAAMLAALPEAVNELQGGTILPAAEGIMTTDLYPKVRRVELGGGSIVGIAKGAGMIEPNLATMLVFILTDIAVPRATLRGLLPKVAADTFNAISIDSDTSTSDTVVVLSSGNVQGVTPEAFAEALRTVCGDLAEDVVRNGEGVHHVVKVTVCGAPDAELARAVAKAVVNSPLFQCAVAGNDPNVGRLVCAVGKHLGRHCPGLDVSRCRMAIGGHTVFDRGVFRLDPGLEGDLAEHLKRAEMYRSGPPDEHGVFRPPVSWPVHERSVVVSIDLGTGNASAAVIGADRTHEYISENADYRS